MVLGKTDANRVMLVAEGLVLEQDLDLNLFYITEHRLVNTSHPKRGVSMEIKFKRKITSEMMTTYLPSMLLMMITYALTAVLCKAQSCDKSEAVTITVMYLYF